MAMLHKERRQERKRIQVAIGHYWLYHKKLRTTKTGDRKEELLQGQIDRITTWEARHDNYDKARELRLQRLIERKEERERMRIKRLEDKEKLRKQKLSENVEREAEKRKKLAEKDRIRINREMKRGETLNQRNQKRKNKMEITRRRNYLMNFIRSGKRPDASKRGENTDKKFTSFEPKFGTKYAVPNVHFSGPLKLFSGESFDFVSEHLLKYRVHETNVLSSRSEGTRPSK